MNEKGGLTAEEVFEAEVGVVLCEANINFQHKDWKKLGISAGKLYLLFVLRMKDEMILEHLKSRIVPSGEMN